MAFYPETPPRPCAEVNESTTHPAYIHLKKYIEGGSDSCMRNIKFRHPGYADTCNVLFELPAIDHPEGGIHYGFAKDACAIVANSRWEGFLSLTGDERAAPLVPPEGGRDNILKFPKGGSFYYHLDSPEPGIVNAADYPSTKPYKWPIVPYFQQWEFPHGKVPAEWKMTVASGEEDVEYQQDKRKRQRTQSSVGATIHSRDVYCRVSKGYVEPQIAHFVPLTEEKWFNFQDMRNYKTRLGYQRKVVTGLMDPANLMLQRHDIHTAGDKKQVWVPHPRGAGGDYVLAMVAHTDYEEMAWTYHGVKFHPIPYCRAEFLLARFAWIILSKITDFLAGERPRLVVQVALNDKGEHVPHIVTRNGFPELEKKHPTPPPIPSPAPVSSAALSTSRKRAPTIDDFEPALDSDSSGSQKRRKLGSSLDDSPGPSPLDTPRLLPNRSLPLAEKPTELYEGEERITSLVEEALIKERERNSAVVSKLEYPSIYDELEANGFDVIRD